MDLLTEVNIAATPIYKDGPPDGGQHHPRRRSIEHGPPDGGQHRQFQKLLDHQVVTLNWFPIHSLAYPLYPLAHLGLARAAAMGDTAKSRKAYEDFFGLWKDADPDIPILIEARQEYEKLK